MGNYDPVFRRQQVQGVMPLREKMGNYDQEIQAMKDRLVIPLREKMGNYDNVSAPNIP